MTEKEIEALIKKMTLEEKAGFCSGADVWHLKSNKRLGIKSIMVSDGPHGLRTPEGGERQSRNQRQHCSGVFSGGVCHRGIV